MSDDRPVDEIELLRLFRQSQATPPEGLQERIEERMWQQILAAEAGQQRRRWWSRRNWADTLARQGSFAAVTAAAVLVVAFAWAQPDSPVQTTSAQTTLDPLEAALRNIPVDSTSSEPPANLAELPERGPLVAGQSVVVFDEGDIVPLSSIAEGPESMTPEQLALLPTQEHTLLALLRAAGGRDPTHDADFEPFRLAALYISDPRVPGEQRVAFVRLLGLLDGVQVGGTGLDVFRRPGVRVSRLDQASLVLQQYLLDKRDGSMLEHREFLAGNRGDLCPRGTVVALEAFDDSGFRVAPEAAPYGNWPAIEPECDPSRV